ncbi:MAG: beta-ketoacyl-ACP synthase II [Gemmatimonadales bacterium]
MTPRVVVTGLGVASPIGIGVGQFWKAALAGRSGVSAVSGFGDLPLELYRSRVAGQIHDFDPGQYIEGPYVERVDRYAQFAMVATKEAIADSGLRIDRENPHRVGTIVGAGMGGMLVGEQEYHRLYEGKRPNRVHPNFIPMITLNSASGVLAITHGAKGPNLTISTACSSSAHAIGLALGAIRTGQADVVIVAGADASISPLVFAGFCTLRALSTGFNDTPEKASRPFSLTRDGFVMGEGAGALILESLAHAKKRKARIYAEVAGYAATSEAYHMVVPREDGLEISITMGMALRNAGVRPAQVDYINAHATSTTIGDTVEIKAIKHLFKSRAARIPINATKSLFGHTLGAAGALAGIVCAMTLDTGQIHPTLNYDDPDPDCALPGISTQAQERKVKVALLNAFGFGSNNAAVVFKKFLR